MLKVVIFDSGYGGEFFADKLEEALPIVEVTRVISWRESKAILKNPRRARKIARVALRPYLGKVDLIIFVNHLLSLTSLRYFERKFKKQKFLGLSLISPDTFIDRGVLILTTNAVAKTFRFRKFVFNLNKTVKVLTADSWPGKIDDGELSFAEIEQTINSFLDKTKFHPQEIILACSQFDDIKSELRKIFGHNVRIYDSFDDVIRKASKILGIRGGIGSKSS